MTKARQILSMREGYRNYRFFSMANYMALHYDWASDMLRWRICAEDNLEISSRAAREILDCLWDRRFGQRCHRPK